MALVLVHMSLQQKKIRWKSLWEKVLARTENVTRMWNNLKKRGEKGDEGMKQDCPKWRLFLCVICYFFSFKKRYGPFRVQSLMLKTLLLWILCRKLLISSLGLLICCTLFSLSTKQQSSRGFQIFAQRDVDLFIS